MVDFCTFCKRQQTLVWGCPQAACVLPRRARRLGQLPGVHRSGRNKLWSEGGSGMRLTRAADVAYTTTACITVRLGLQRYLCAL